MDLLNRQSEATQGSIPPSPPDISFPIRRSSASRWQWPAVAFIAGMLQVAFLLATNGYVRNTVVLLALTVLALLIAAGARLRPTVRAFGIAMTASVLAVSLLNLWFERHVEANPKRGEAFREVMRTEQWPVYGFKKSSRWPHSFASIAAWSLLAYWACGRGRRMALQEKRDTAALIALCAASGLAMVCFAFGKSRERWLEILPADMMFIDDARHFQNLGDVLRSYVGQMHELSWLGAHYPPGNLVLLGGLGVTGKYVLLLATAASPALVWLAARRMGGSRAAAWWAAALVATAPYVLMHASVSATTIVVPLSALSLWLAAFCLDEPSGAASRTRLVLSAGALGAVLAVWSFFTFGVAFHALMLVVLLILCLVGRQLLLQRAVASVLITLGVLCALLSFLMFTSGYDTFAALREARANHFEQIGGIKLPPHEALVRSLLRSLGNVLAFWTAHLPATAVALLALGLFRWQRAPALLLMPAVVVTILIAGFCGTFTLETERIWLFLVPPVAIAAGEWLADRGSKDADETPVTVVFTSACLALVIASTFKPYTD